MGFIVLAWLFIIVLVLFLVWSSYIFCFDEFIVCDCNHAGFIVLAWLFIIVLVWSSYIFCFDEFIVCDCNHAFFAWLRIVVS